MFLLKLFKKVQKANFIYQEAGAESTPAETATPKKSGENCSVEAPEKRTKRRESRRKRTRFIHNYLRKDLHETIGKGESYTKTGRLQAAYLAAVAKKQRARLTKAEKADLEEGPFNDGTIRGFDFKFTRFHWDKEKCKYAGKTLWSTMMTSFNKMGYKKRSLRGKMANHALSRIANGKGLELISDKAKSKIKEQNGFYNIWTMPLGRVGVKKFEYRTNGKLYGIDKNGDDVLSFDLFTTTTYFEGDEIDDNTAPKLQPIITPPKPVTPKQPEKAPEEFKGGEVLSKVLANGDIEVTLSTGKQIVKLQKPEDSALQSKANGSDKYIEYSKNGKSLWIEFHEVSKGILKVESGSINKKKKFLNNHKVEFDNASSALVITEKVTKTEPPVPEPDAGRLDAGNNYANSPDIGPGAEPDTTEEIKLENDPDITIKNHNAETSTYEIEIKGIGLDDKGNNIEMKIPATIIVTDAGYEYKTTLIKGKTENEIFPKLSDTKTQIISAHNEANINMRVNKSAIKDKMVAKGYTLENEEKTKVTYKKDNTSIEFNLVKEAANYSSTIKTLEEDDEVTKEASTGKLVRSTLDKL